MTRCPGSTTTSATTCSTTSCRPTTGSSSRSPSYGGGVTKASRASIEKLARERLGFERLRPGQWRAVGALAAGRDVLAVLPTGAGKSAIYELAGLLRTGPVVVVSPLIALQDDQLAHLKAAGLRAVVLNSQQSAGARAAALLASCESGTFVFLAPEQLANAEARAAVQRARPGLFVVDEAHLISQWGRDFRPDYMRLGAAAEAVGAAVRLALTATAAPPVRQEIVRRFGLRDPEVVIGDFDPPNIELSVHRSVTEDDKHGELVRGAAAAGGAGIVYAATHASAQAAHDVLAAAGERVALYHAGLSAGARRAAMAAFMDGSARVLAAPGPDRRAHRRVRHGHRQAGRALGNAPRPAVLAGRVLPGAGAGRPGRRGVARAAAVPLRGLRDGAVPDRPGRLRRRGGQGRGRAGGRGADRAGRAAADRRAG